MRHPHSERVRWCCTGTHKNLLLLAAQQDGKHMQNEDKADYVSDGSFVVRFGVENRFLFPLQESALVASSSRDLTLQA